MLYYMCKGTFTNIGGVILENRLVELRKNFNLSQEDFAKKINVSRQTVSSIENGRYNPSLDLAFQIAEVFNMQIEEIFIYRSEQNEEK